MHLVKYCTLWYMYWGEGGGVRGQIELAVGFFFFKDGW